MSQGDIHQFETYQIAEHGPGHEGKVATQLMRLHRTAKALERPTILELGTDIGVSGMMFLHACQDNGGHLVSVDIKDCSSVLASSQWQFIQSDSSDVDAILSQAPELRDGIDLLYIDSLHTKKHVEKELTGWFPYMKQGSHIFFDDIDPNPYRKRSRKDNVSIEVEYDKIREYVESFFYANEDSLHLEVMLGSTGLGHMYKLSPQGTPPKQARPMINRRAKLSSVVNIPRHGPKMLLTSLAHKMRGY